ncbi:DUF3426 domain-containing protein [Halopseudomonas salegens]|uniref:MJ0042 family finger-like domain-containing protein n=1 Tax=Halopseudomonas salegens TaxID=1434072 RepID=A0A1H2GH70_9GAMM|nr:DUF3426 domain-containing protein [Halopseudomonas salegens]SDU18993.1 MJ0042 family finger-like domain-containing protein [Halopseudomonas salegens]
MSATLVTQCPHCQTRFRLSQEHLRAAAGNVRCGACLKVFNANPPAAGDGAAAISDDLRAMPDHQPRTKTRLDDVLIHDDLELDDLDLEDLGLDESIIDEVNPAPPPQQSSLPLASPAAPSSADKPQAVQPSSASQPSFPKPEPEPEPEPDIETVPTVDEQPRHASWLSPSDQTAAPLSTKDDSPPATTTQADIDDHPPEHGIFLRDQPQTEALETTPSSRKSAEQPADTEPDRPGNDRQADSNIPAGSVTDETDARREPLLGDDFILPDMDSETFLLDDQAVSRPRPRNALWGILSLLAIVALIGQFGYFNFAALAHDERSRSFIASWCNLAGCQLPPQVDISLIRSSNLTVRPHPEYPNTLAIDVILYNRADFAQPFPVLRMRFSDQRDREVASRLFRPQEYLGGELAGARLMPSQTPIHVGLSMLSPEQAGSSYRLDFLSPEH